MTQSNTENTTPVTPLPAPILTAANDLGNALTAHLSEDPRIKKFLGFAADTDLTEGDKKVWLDKATEERNRLASALQPQIIAILAGFGLTLTPAKPTSSASATAKAEAKDFKEFASGDKQKAIDAAIADYAMTHSEKFSKGNLAEVMKTHGLNMEANATSQLVSSRLSAAVERGLLMKEGEKGGTTYKTV